MSEAIRRSLCDISAEIHRFNEARRLLRDRVPDGHSYVVIRGDGNCMFAAFSQALQALRGECVSPSCARSACVEAIRGDPCLSERFFDAAECNAFCTRMAEDGEYGDELCLQGLVAHFKVRVQVVMPATPPVIFGSGDDLITLAYNGFNHYDVILPISPSVPSVASALERGASCQGDPPASPTSGPACKQGRELVLLSANITAWQSRHMLFDQFPAAIKCFQEVRLDSKRAADAVRKVRAAGDRLACGGPVRAQGGVAVQACSPATALPCPSDVATWYDAGRALGVAVAIADGRRLLHVFTVYGICGAAKDPAKFARNETLLASVFAWAALYGPGPCVVCGDFNIDPSHSPACLAACAAGGWHDLGAEAGAKPTFHAVRHKRATASRIDAIFCNQHARPLVSDFHFGHFDIPNHKALIVRFRLPPFNATVRVLTGSKSLPTSTLDASALAALAESCLCPIQERWHALLECQDVDSAWDLLCRTCHRFVHARGTDTPPNSCDRGLAPVVRQRLLFPPRFDNAGFSVRLSRLFRLQRRIQEASLARAKRGFAAATLLAAIRRSFSQLCVGLTFSSMPHAAAQVRNETHCELQLLERQRLAAWKLRMQQSWAGHKRDVFKWIRAHKALQAVPDFVSSPYGLCAAPAELLKRVIAKWTKIFCKYSDGTSPSWAPFAERYSAYFSCHAVKLPPLDPRRLQRLACGGRAAASGLDAWTKEALKAWPQQAWTSLCQLLDAVERTGRWPQRLLRVLVALIPKPLGKSPDDLRLITIASIIYRAWASARARDLMPWQTAWCPQELHGGVRGHAAADLYLQVAVELESAFSGGSPVAGILLDLSKFFDHLPWDIEYGMLSSFGCPDRVLGPKRHLACSAARWFKLGSSISAPLNACNGTPQGCPLSILSVNALMSIWCKVLRAEAPQVRAGCFIDDRSLRSGQAEALKTAVHLTDEFDSLSESVSNQDKTKLLCTDLPLEQELQGFMHGELPVSPVSDAPLLGVNLPARAVAVCHLGRARTEAAIVVANRVQYAPLHFEARAVCLSSAALSKWRHGLEVGGHPIDAESQLRHSVAEALGARRSHACRDVFFAICCNGSLLDPHQIRAVHTLCAVRSFLLRWPCAHELWRGLWSARAAESFRGRFGLAAQLQRACAMLDLQWSHAFKVQSDSEVLLLLTCCKQFSRERVCAHAQMSLLLRALRRPGYQGLSWDVDFHACGQYFSEYNKGVLRSILCQGVLTQTRPVRSSASG